MPAMCRMLVLGLASLVVAAPALADKIITANEVIPCSVEWADAHSVCLMLPHGVFRGLPILDIYEVRLPDSARVAELTSLLPQARVVLDSGQLVSPPEIRVREAMLLRLDRAREAHTNGTPWPMEIVGMPSPKPSPEELAWRCMEMDAVLRHCGRSDSVIAGLLRGISVTVTYFPSPSSAPLTLPPFLP
jgi:hypothetical protein